MINEEFKRNWITILNYNQKSLCSKNDDELNVMVRIPFTPIEIDAKILKELFEVLYPQFINDQQNILDIIISDDENTILNAYLYQTKKAGIHESIEHLPLEVIRDKIFPYKKKDLEDIELFFNKLQLRLIENKKVRISSIRIFKKKFIDLVNDLYKILDLTTLNEYLHQFFNFIQEVYGQELLYMYPNPPINSFITNFFKFLNCIKVSGFIEIIMDILPVMKISLLFYLLNSHVVLDLKNTSSSSINENMNISIRSLEEMEIECIKKTIPEILKQIVLNQKSDMSYYIDLNALLSLLLEIFETDFPPKRENSEYIFQKLLYGVRNYENLWFKAPRLNLFNLKRYFLRYLGINVNIKKLSHWSIPPTISALFHTYFGLKSRILFIYTDSSENKSNLKVPLDHSFKKAGILEFENNRIESIVPVRREEILNNETSISLEAIRSSVSKNRGYLSAVISMDKALLREFIDQFILNLSSPTLFKKMKVLKMFKNERYLDMYPVIPLLKLMRDSSPLKLLKLLTSVAIDKHEF